ncbi:hypothetical protein Tco_1400129 [Tanacetum coccineum]
MIQRVFVGFDDLNAADILSMGTREGEARLTQSTTMTQLAVSRCDCRGVEFDSVEPRLSHISRAPVCVFYDMSINIDRKCGHSSMGRREACSTTRSCEDGKVYNVMLNTASLDICTIKTVVERTADNVSEMRVVEIYYSGGHAPHHAALLLRWGLLEEVEAADFEDIYLQLTRGSLGYGAGVIDLSTQLIYDSSVSRRIHGVFILSETMELIIEAGSSIKQRGYRLRLRGGLIRLRDSALEGRLS